MAEEKIKKLLEHFEKNKEWADLVNWLNKLNDALKTPTLKKIPQEDILAKRLSQCLNQSLPNAVHILTLETYGIIFQMHCDEAPSDGESGKKFKPWGSSLAYYSPGLFSFYQFAKLEVKLRFNELIKKYYLRIGSEILSCLNGLIGILLLGLDDSNEEALRGIEEILQALMEKKVGTRIFFGTIWLAILRTSKIRYPALRYIMKIIPCTAETFPSRKLFINQDAFKITNNEPDNNEIRIVSPATEKPITEEELLYHFYPQKSSLVVNALIQCLQDESIFTQRCTFDFLSTHMPLHSDILSYNEKVCLIEAGCHLLLKKNDSIVRRFYLWVLGDSKEKEGFEDFSATKGSVALKVFVKAVLNLFKEVPKDIKSAGAPIQIVKAIFEDNEGLTERLLPDIASTIVKYLETYKTSYPFSEDLSNQGRKLLSGDKQLVLVWRALGSELSELMGEQNYKKVLQTINLIKFFLTAYDTTKDKFASKSKYLKPIFSRILMSMMSLSNNLSIMEYTIPGLRLIQDIMHILRQETQIETVGLLEDGVKKFVAFYLMFISYIMEGKFEKDEESWKFVEKAFSLATENVVSLQVYVNPEKEGIEWLTKLIKCIEAPSTQCEITLICIEGVISIYEQQSVGSSFQHLQGCIKKESEIISKLWDMIGQSLNDRKVVELVQRADKVMSSALSDCVNQELLATNTTDKVAAINRFSLFWKLAAEYYPSFVPFANAPLCLFHMVDAINNDHPLVRHSSKSWLAESTRHLERILDPLILKLFQDKSKEVCDADRGTIIHPTEYESEAVRYSLMKLRSILLTNKTDLMSFMMTKRISPCLMEKYMAESPRMLINMLSEEQTYVELLLYMSIKYTRCQVAKGVNFVTENAGVNASGSEFLELILTSVEPSEKAPDVASRVIQPLLVGLHNAFLSKDSVMQVEILKLIRLIQFKCYAPNRRYAENCLRIFTDKYYMIILQSGLESETSYVRSSYISYVVATLPLYTTFMGERLEIIISPIMKFLCNNLALCSAISVIKGTEEKLIANENDILQILGGVKAVVNHYFVEADAELDKEEKIALQKLIGIPSGRKAKSFVETTKNNILNTFGEIFSNCQRIWKRQPPKVIKDFDLTHKGILPFTALNYTETLDLYYREEFSFKVVEKELTSYQQALIAIASPIIQKHPHAVIKSLLENWIKEQEKGNDEALRKIIDMLVLLKVPADHILNGAVLYLEGAADLKPKKTSGKGPQELKYSVVRKEASICLFLYAFFIYTYDWYKKDEKTEERIKVLRPMWNSVAILFKLMMANKSPTTLCWLYDIMFIMGIKYDPRDVTTQEKKVRRSIEDVISQLASDTVSIAANPVTALIDEKFSLMFSNNPSICGLLEKIELTEEEKKEKVTEADVLNHKIRKMMPQLGSIVAKEGGPRLRGAIQGPLCYYYLKGYCFLTMRAMLYDLTEKMLSVANKDKMGQVFVSVMSNLFPIISQREELYGELASDVLKSVLRTREEYVAFRKNILDVFLSDDFFIVPPKSSFLKKWKQILNWFLENDKNELFNELISQLTAKTIMFTSKAYDMTKKYQALKRLAFLILSGKKDQFEESYSVLITKLMEGIRDSENLHLVTQYLTLLRVMFLRFGQLNEPTKETAKNIQTLWPNIMCKLIQIFQDPANQKPMVVMASLRLIEIMSVLNIEDHTLFQWVFLVDSFGWKVLNNDTLDEGDMKKGVKITRETFVPLCINILASKFTATFINEPEGGEKVDIGDSLQQVNQDRRLVFLNKVGAMMEVTQVIISYICYLSMSNVSSTVLQLETIEEQIEKDFISEKEEVIL